MIITSALKAACLDPETSSAVVTVPASFQKEQRQVTEEAVRSAGFTKVACIDEPLSATLAYRSYGMKGISVVYDFGGGTFDVAIVDSTGERYKVLAHAGDANIGGDDIDRSIASQIADHVLKEYHWDLRSDPSVYDRLVFESEVAKIKLSQVEKTSISLSLVDPASPASIKSIALDQSSLIKTSDRLVRRTFLICDELFTGTNIRAQDIDHIILAGGTTFVPGIRERVGEYFQKNPRIDIDPTHVVSLGASMMNDQLDYM